MIFFIEPVSGEDALGTVLQAAPQPEPQSQGCRTILFGRGGNRAAVQLRELGLV